MYAKDFSQVGDNIQKELDRRGMTQQSLADMLGISKQVMHKIVKGSKAINVNELSRIAETLGVTTDELLTVETAPDTESQLWYMGSVTDQETLDKVNLIRQAIDEIHMLEEALNEE